MFASIPSVIQHVKAGKLRALAVSSARRSALAVAGRSPELCFRAGLVIGGRDRDEPRLLAKAVQAYRRWTEAKPFWN